MSWEDKVHRVIGKLSAASHRHANTSPSGKRYKKHRPYHIPDEARALVECLGDRDRTRAEHTCKATMEMLRRRGVAID